MSGSSIMTAKTSCYKLQVIFTSFLSFGTPPLRWQAGAYYFHHVDKETDSERQRSGKCSTARIESQVCQILNPMIFLNLLSLKKKNWSIVALECCVSFCWIMKCISYMYAYISSLLDLPLSPRPIPSISMSSQSTELSSLCYIAGFHYLFYTWQCTYVKYCLLTHVRAKELMLLNCGAGEDTWESPELQGGQTSRS